MISADASEGQSERERLEDAYLVKPVRLVSLLDTLAQQLKLVWETSQTQSAAPRTAHNAAPETIDLLQLPADAHLQHLRKLALIGHKSGLLQTLTQLKESGEADARFVHTLSQLASRFQFETIIRLLQVTDHERQSDLS